MATGKRVTVKDLRARIAELEAEVVDLKTQLEATKPPEGSFRVTLTEQDIIDATRKVNAENAKNTARYNEARREAYRLKQARKPSPPVAVPAEFQAMMGGPKYQPVATSDEWQKTYSHTWSGNLSEKVQNQYLRDCRAAFRLMTDEAPPKSTNPGELMQWALHIEPPINIWELCRRCMAHASVHTRNNYGKALLGVGNAAIRLMTEGDPDERRLAMWCGVFQKINFKTKTDTFSNHLKQGQSEYARSQTVSWPEWVPIAREFIKLNESSDDFEDRRNAAIIACYSLIPPIRNDWASVQIKTRAPVDGDKSNTIVFGQGVGGAIDVYWGDFKNVAAFGKTPVHILIDSDELRVVLRSYLHTLPKGCKWLFPKRTAANKMVQMTSGFFGKLLGDITFGLTGKRFSSQRMRASYITSYHLEKADKKQTVNLGELEIIMKQLHQTDVTIHLGYSKTEASHAEWAQKAFQQSALDLVKEADNEP